MQQIGPAVTNKLGDKFTERQSLMEQQSETILPDSGRTATSVAEVVSSGLCIGCGLCEAVTTGRVPMQMTEYGGLRPSSINKFTKQEEDKILAACPGIIAELRPDNAPNTDLIWGSYFSMNYGWAGDAERRFASSSGGVLTALGCHLLKTKKTNFILHVGPDPDMPMRSRWVMSRTAEEVQRNAGSRYGPVAPLAGLENALQREERFAIIAKPCDLGAVHRLSKVDDRVDRVCVARLTLVCGGQSRLGKSTALLNEFGVLESELTLFRYRGFGNPGRTRVETRDGSAFETTYAEFWKEEAGWDYETRCKFCPDALGEASDIAATDVWPGANPTKEDAGFNGVICRTQAGKDLLDGAVAGDDLVLGDPITPRQFDSFQPHQVRRKLALRARFQGLAQANMPMIETVGLRLDKLAEALDAHHRQEETSATIQRALAGRFSEPLRS
ncbi:MULTISPECIES: Coenzyme F420 hydrogenase/dehydrogenase, beta subunit C-terminal domain [Mesorhizobium]|uniref:Coenzyme F420 hydrogenase/dehydrogenase, beta subunit C-terminal domain n=2 Tax=Mesorhizobium TaxID=68287 RepID=UPI0010A97B74|nr:MULTISPECIES: Coenzyme F420 hydrogenase/dehydrogenase, beta subunit C-terminal domain [Mesorhizobium]